MQPFWYAEVIAKNNPPQNKFANPGESQKKKQKSYVQAPDVCGPN